MRMVLTKRIATGAMCTAALLGMVACTPKANPTTTPTTSSTPSVSATASASASASASKSASPSASASKSASASPSASASAAKADISKIKDAAGCDKWTDVSADKLAQYPGLAESVCTSPLTAVITSDGTTFPLIKEFWQGFATEPSFRGYVATDLNTFGVTTGDDQAKAQKLADQFGGKVCKLVDSDIQC